jgi:hypothetical protein
MLAVVLMVNYLATRHYTRRDLSSAAQWQLSPLTQRVMQSLTNEVRVTVFFNPDRDLYTQVISLLKEYMAINPKLSLRLVNPRTNPVEAQNVISQHKLTPGQDKNSVIFECQGQSKVIPAAWLLDSELEQMPSETERVFRKRPTAFKGELAFTSALISVTHPKGRRAFFLQDHREHNPISTDEQVGYSKFTALLLENNIQPELLSLLGSAEVPVDCHLLIIAAPLDPLPQEELDKIARYLDHGGRLLVLFNNNTMTKRLGLEKVLANWGVVVGENLILDDTRKVEKSRGRQLSLNTFGSHPIVDPLNGSTVQLLMPRSVSAVKSGTPSADTPRVVELLYTSDQGLAATDIRDGVVYVNPARSVRGNYPLMAAVEKGTVRGVAAGRGSTRIVVTGDSFFLSNQMIDSGANRDFAGHAVNWLLDRTELLAGIGPRAVREYKLNLSQTQMVAVRWALLGGMPGAVLFIGLLVWLRRRK